MPLCFEPAGDRAGSGAEFVARGDGYAVDLARGHAKIVVGPASDTERLAIGMRLAGASPLATAGVRNPMPGVTNYLIGSNPREWRTGVRSYAEVEYHDVYPGVDIVYYGNQRRLEYDFIVAPGASHKAIAMAFDDATAVRIDPTGDLVIATAAGNLVQHAPVIYQYKDGKREQVQGGYVRRTRNQFGFRVGKHDPHLPLVIDPVLSYATYLGGAREERAGGVAVDAQGNIYLTGLTGASNFPAAAAPDLTHGRDNWDAFVVKLNAAGDQLQYATYLGGSGYEEPSDIDVDPAGNAYVVGTTSSWDFPTLHAMQPSLRGFNDTFVAKLDATGAVVYSTYLGGKQDESSGGIAVDQLGRAYVTGATWSPDFPTVNAMQPSLGGHAAFRTTDGGRTWIGMSNGLRTNGVLTFAIHPGDTATVYAGTQSDGVFKSADGGATWAATSADLPPLPVNALGIAADGALYVANDASVYRSTDRGASWIDLQVWTAVSAVIVDPASGTVYIGLNTGYPGVFVSTDGGQTWNDTGLRDGVYSLAVSQSVVYAGTANGVFKNIGGSGWQPTGVADGYVPLANVTSISVNPNDAGQVYAGTQAGLFYTMSGGAEWTAVPAWSSAPVLSVSMAPSASSTVYVASAWGSGMTDDGGMTWRLAGAGTMTFCFVVDPVAPANVYAGTFVSSDVFVSRISADGSSLEYSTYLGGTSSESASDIAIDSAGAAYVVGTTQSTDFPTLNPFQGAAGGLMDVFVAKLSEAGSLTYATYLGGWGSDYSPRVAVDAAGQAHVVGVTFSQNFPVANAHQPSFGGGYSDVFVTTLNQAGSGLVYSTFLGGGDQEVDGSQSLGPAVAVGPSGETVVTGTTRSRNFPTRDAIQSAHAGGSTDAFVANFDSAGHLQYSTYLGGTGDDYGRRVAVDSTGSIVVVGATSSHDFPTRHALQSSNAGAEDVFVARIASVPPDTTAPTTTVVASGTPGSNGWYRSPVQITLTAADDAEGSGVGFIEYSVNEGVFQRYGTPFSIASQGTTVVRARATDAVGNVENPPATLTVTIDTDAPAITVSSPNAADYVHSDVLHLSFVAGDSVSGVARGNPTAMLDASAVANGQAIQLLGLSLGPHTLVVSASDQAGNVSVQTVQFRITATIDSLIAAVNAFTAQGQIDADTARSLLSKLSRARQSLNEGKLSSARSKLLDFREEVSQKSGRSIAAGAAHVLLADVDYVLSAI
jgi:hypothetical protein